MLPSHRRRHPMDWTPAVTRATLPRTHARRPTPPDLESASGSGGPKNPDTHAPSVRRGPTESRPVPPPTKTATPPLTPAPSHPGPSAPQLRAAPRSALDVVVSASASPICDDDIRRDPDRPPRPVPSNVFIFPGDRPLHLRRKAGQLNGWRKTRRAGGIQVIGVFEQRQLVIPI